MTLPPAFADAQTKYATLRQLLAAGTMTEAQFQAALKSLMVLHEGRYWSMGAQTGLWHVNDGGTWRRADPPAAAASHPPPPWPPHPGPAPPPPPRPSSALPLVLGLVGGLFALVVLVAAVIFVPRFIRALTPPPSAAAAAPSAPTSSSSAPIGDGPQPSGPSPVTAPPLASTPTSPPPTSGGDGSSGSAIARTAREDGQSTQAQQVDVSGRVTVEAATIHQMTCASGRAIYVYEYTDRAAFRAIQPPDWGTPLGGRDFASFSDAVAAGCAG